MLLALSWGTLSLATVSSINLPTQLLPVYGGSGGIAFTRSCGAGKVLTGLTYRTGLWVDGVGLLCRPVNADGTLGSETTVGTLAGGGGGTSGSGSCPSGQVVWQVYIYYQSFVNGIDVRCSGWDAGARKMTGYAGFGPSFGKRGSGQPVQGEQCEAPTQPAHGIRGRAAAYVDAIGFICDEP